MFVRARWAGARLAAPCARAPATCQLIIKARTSSSAAEPPAAAKPPRREREAKRPAVWQSYLALTKPRLASFVVLSAAVGFAMAPVALSAADFCAAVTGTALTVAAANAGNQALEREHDSRMARTRLRPLPRGLLSVRQASAFGLACLASGSALLAAACNPLAAALAAGNAALYVCVYTPLKRVHWLNTWVGALVGAVPPVIGWAAATGGELGVGAAALAAVLYAWQIPHFLSLSWTIRREYERGGYQMMARSLAHRVGAVTFLWALYTLPLGAMCAAAGLTSKWFALTSLVPGVPLVLAARDFARDRTTQNSRKVFRWTLAWLPAFLLLMMVHKSDWSAGFTLGSLHDEHEKRREKEASSSNSWLASILK